jgi:hypothetical protein
MHDGAVRRRVGPLRKGRPMRPAQRWAVKCWCQNYPREMWAAYNKDSLWPITRQFKWRRTIFTDLKLARAVAIVTGGKVFKVKS